MKTKIDDWDKTFSGQDEAEVHKRVKEHREHAWQNGYYTWENCSCLIDGGFEIFVVSRKKNCL